MADAEWIDNMRKIVLQAVEAGDPCDIVSGTVTKTANWIKGIGRSICIPC